jgi:hypothetical protein
MLVTPKVFISHKNEDAVQAAMIADRLTRQHGLAVYLDVIDSQLRKDGVDLADYIRDKLEECTQLLAVLSSKTQVSWWVPWEIGVATEKRRFLSSYVSDLVSIPEYLTKWPYLRSMSDLDRYAEQSKRSVQVLNEELRYRSQDRAFADQFRSFHRSLRTTLRQ